MRERRRTSTIRAVGAVLGLVGGALIVSGVLAPWVRSQGVSVGAVAVPGDVRGIEVTLGLLAITAGAAAIILALVVLLTQRRAARLLAASLIITSLAAGVVVLVEVSDPAEAYIDFAIAQASDASESTEGVDESLHRLIKGSALDVELGLGLWLTVGGAALALVGGCLVLLSGPRTVATDVTMGFKDPVRAPLRPPAESAPDSASAQNQEPL
jgi:hypothetical protein